jgi:hypothetical protein
LKAKDIGATNLCKYSRLRSLPRRHSLVGGLEERKRRLVDAYVYEQAIDKQTYSQEFARVSQDLTLVKVEHHGNVVGLGISW